MIEQSVSVAHRNFLSVKPHSVAFSINGYPLYQYEKPILNLAIQSSPSEYLLQKYKDFIKILSSDQSISSKIIPFYPSEEEFFAEKECNLLSDRVHISYREKEPLTELENRIYNIYNEYQEKNWDGYGAEPMQYLNQSLQFAKALFAESRILIESVEVIPENDGCLCFEWFKSNSKFINISVKDDKLIYTYKFGDDKSCGETTFPGKHMLIEQVKKIV